MCLVMGMVLACDRKIFWPRKKIPSVPCSSSKMSTGVTFGETENFTIFQNLRHGLCYVAGVCRTSFHLCSARINFDPNLICAVTVTTFKNSVWFQLAYSKKLQFWCWVLKSAVFTYLHWKPWENCQKTVALVRHVFVKKPTVFGFRVKADWALNM